MSNNSAGLRLSLRVLIYGLLLSLLLLVLVLPRLANIEWLSEIDQRLLIAPLLTIALTLVLVQTRMTNRRLEILAQLADEIGKGNYGARSDDMADDAIGSLARSVNFMANKISSTIDALESSRLELEQSRGKLEEQNSELSLVVGRQERFGEFLGNIHSIELNVIANTAIDYLMDVASAQIGLFYFYDEQKKTLVCLSQKSLDRRLLNHFSSDGDLEGLPAEVMRRREWVSIEDIDVEALPEINLGFTRARIRSLYGIPVVFQRRLLGVAIVGGMKSMDASTRQYLRNHVEALANSFINAITYRSVQKQSVQLEEANRELLRAQKTKSEFVANMSHELRTPLNSIIGFSGILMKNKNGNLSDSDLSRVEKINRNGRHLLSLINDILDLSKIEAGRMDFVREETDLVYVIQDVGEMLQPQADAKEVALVCKLPSTPLMVPTDSHKLKQVLINLVGNAIKFTRKGSVTIVGDWANESVGVARIRVIDTGVGIKPDALKRIFDPFTQADSSTSREFGGTGLGLTISKNIVEAMGGRLEVSSVFGEGSTFAITLDPRKWAAAAKGDRVYGSAAPFQAIAAGTTSPIPGGSRPPTAPGTTPPTPEVTVPPIPADALQPQSDPADGSAPASKRTPRRRKRKLTDDAADALRRVLPITAGKKVVVVDDDPDAREFIAAYVTELGAKVRQCGDPLELKPILREFQPDLITLDVMMPGMSGWEVLTDLKHEPEFADIPVVIVSMVADKKKAISLGAVDALSKPVERDDFMACARRTLNSEVVENRRILVVDDNEAQRSIMKVWLDEKKNDVRTAGNGREALEVLEGFIPDAVFLDLVMPVMDGFAFLKEMRSVDKWARIPVIITTGKDLSTHEKDFLEKRASRILSKEEIKLTEA